MITLVLDLAYVPTIALLDKGALVCVRDNGKNLKSDNVMVLIDQILKDNNLSINDVKEIAVNVGPGSFTGLRVAISIAKGLGFGSSINYKTFNSFDFIEKNEKKNVVLTGFSSFVYLKDAKGKQDCVDIASLDKNQTYFVYEEVVFNKMQEFGFKVKFESKLGYAQVVNKIKKACLMNELEPLYLRKSQAELQREEKLQGKKI